MTAPNFTYVGAKAPDAVTIDITPSASVPDLSVVTAATCAVVRPGGQAPVTWATSLSNQTATTLRLTWAFASDGTDVPIAGGYIITPSLVTPGGVRRCKPVKLLVRGLTP